MRLGIWTAAAVLLLAPTALSAQHEGHGSGGMDMGGSMSMPMSKADPAQDDRFLSMAPHHHMHGLDLAKLGVEKASSEDVRTMASHLAETEQMALDRLRAVQEKLGIAPEEATQDGGGMAGMSGMTHMGGGNAKNDPMAKMQQHLDRLRLLEGAAFDRAFLDIVKQHHEGAERMARDEVRRGARGEVKVLAQDLFDGSRQELANIRTLQKAAKKK